MSTGSNPVIDEGLRDLFDASPSPSATFSTQVLRRVQEQRLRHQMRLARTLYLGMFGSGGLMIVGLSMAFRASAVTLSGNLMMAVAIVGVGATFAATGRRLLSHLSIG